MARKIGKKPKVIAWTGPFNGEQGVVTGCDSAHEWMLPWWFDHYSKRNKYPVTFANFGMSPSMAAWCKERGHLLDLTFYCKKNWFKKPLAVLMAGYQNVIWLDSDCEIRADLAPLFEFAKEGFGVTLDPHNPWCKKNGCKKVVASGIIATHIGHELAVEWAEKCLISHKFRGDQEVLNEMIKTQPQRVDIMPPEYQWLRIDGDKDGVLVMHWTGSRGKQHIRKQMGPRNHIRRRRKNQARVEAANPSRPNQVAGKPVKSITARPKATKKKPKPINIPSRDAVMSRNTISSAPAWLYFFANSAGSPAYLICLNFMPFTPLPSGTVRSQSRQGMIRLVSILNNSYFFTNYY